MEEEINSFYGNVKMYRVDFEEKYSVVTPACLIDMNIDIYHWGLYNINSNKVSFMYFLEDRVYQSLITDTIKSILNKYIINRKEFSEYGDMLYRLTTGKIQYGHDEFDSMAFQNIYIDENKIKIQRDDTTAGVIILEGEKFKTVSYFQNENYENKILKHEDNSKQMNQIYKNILFDKSENVFRLHLECSKLYFAYGRIHIIWDTVSMRKI